MADGELDVQDGVVMSQGPWAGWRAHRNSDAFEDLAGPYYSRQAEDGGWISAFRAEPKHMNGGGFMHGGCVMTFADFCLFIIGREALGDHHGVTVTLNGEFVGPAHVGDLIEGTGEVVRGGGSLIFIRGLISTGGKTMMSFSGVVKKMGKR